MDNLQISQVSVSLQCVFHSIRFKVNKGWSTAVLLFLCLYISVPRNINYLYEKIERHGYTYVYQQLSGSIRAAN
ncbi:hypothetical protein DW121_11375 [Bacteroides sp. AM10-21B]|nr:hypothetical protein DW121_11375 [Bacteroides sp. AM10-21B]